MHDTAQVYALEAGRTVLSKVLISGGGRCNVMHNPLKGPNEISKVVGIKAFAGKANKSQLVVCGFAYRIYYYHMYVQGYPRGSRELLGPLSSRFSPADTYNWFTSRGVTLKTERDGRVFPSTDRSCASIPRNMWTVLHV